MLSLFSSNESQAAAKKLEQATEPTETPETAEPTPVQKNLKDEDVKLETINRLKKVLGTLQYSQPGADATGEPVRVAVSSEPASDRPAAAVPKVTSIDRVPEKAAPVESPVTDEPREQEVAMSAEIQKFAEDFTRNFLGAVAGTFQEMHGLLAEDRGRVAAAIEEFAGQIAALREQTEAHSRLLADVQSVIQNLHPRQEALEKRMELQAGAIRTIHAAVQEREDRFNKLLLTLQPPTAPPNASGLPDNL